MNRAWILGAGVAALVAGVYALNAQVVPQPGPPVAIACAFNTVRPTLTTGQAGWVQCDNAGQLLVSGGGGGGGSVTQGTVPWVVDTVASGGNLIDAINSPIPVVTSTLNHATASATGSLLAGCQYLSALPTYTNTEQGACTFDVNGRLLVSTAAVATFNNNADNVATSATNGQSAAWNYVWDGSAWDRLYGDSTNGVFVNVKSCTVCGGVSAIDEAAFTAGTSVFAPGGGFFQTTATANALTNGQQGMAQMTAQRALFNNLRNASGVEVGTASAPLSINTQTIAGTTASVNVGTPDAGTQRVAQADALSLTPASVTSATTIFTQDMTGYGGVSVSVTSAGSATITYETSDDNSTWVATSGQASTSTGLIFEILTTTAVVGTRVFPKRGRYFRARVSSYTSGTVTVFATLLKDYPSWVPSTIITAIGGTTTQTPISTMNSANGSGAMPTAVAGVLDDTSPTTITENSFGFVRIDPNRALTVKPYSSSGSDWRYPAAASGISNTTTAVTIKAADAALRNYVTGADLMCDALGAATEVAIRDGAGGTVLWRTKVGTAGLAFSQFNFATPLRGTAATLLEVVTLTASITGACYFNAGGYIGP